MEDDISRVLTYEIKREIADRYFGFRRFIEEDKAALHEKMKRHALILEQNLCHDLARIYILLRDEDLVDSFLALTHLHQQICYDPFLKESRQLRERLLKGVRVLGFSPARRFRKLVCVCYEHLYRHVDAYREGFALLVAERDTINEEIKLFYQKNDLHEIMTFLRALDRPFTPGLEGGLETGMTEDLEKKMLLAPVGPVEEVFPFVPSLPPLGKIRKGLHTLADQAFSRHRDQLVDLV